MQPNSCCIPTAPTAHSSLRCGGRAQCRLHTEGVWELQAPGVELQRGMCRYGRRAVGTYMDVTTKDSSAM